jgi:hypothetical protein
MKQALTAIEPAPPAATGDPLQTFSTQTAQKREICQHRRNVALKFRHARVMLLPRLQRAPKAA